MAALGGKGDKTGGDEKGSLPGRRRKGKRALNKRKEERLDELMGETLRPSPCFHLEQASLHKSTRTIRVGDFKTKKL